MNFFFNKIFQEIISLSIVLCYTFIIKIQVIQLSLSWNNALIAFEVRERNP